MATHFPFEQESIKGTIVVCETVWVLERAYRYERDVIAQCDQSKERLKINRVNISPRL